MIGTAENGILSLAPRVGIIKLEARAFNEDSASGVTSALTRVVSGVRASVGATTSDAVCSV